MASAVGRAVPRISVGTAVVPIYPRHPQILASAAKTAQAATGGRFHLGIGPGAKDLLEPAHGLPYPPPITHLREYLGALRPLLDGADTGYRGATVTSHLFGATAVAGAEQAIPVAVAAMGPQALRITGEFADGTLPFLAGPKALEQHIIPVLTQGSSRRWPTGTSDHRHRARGGHRQGRAGDRLGDRPAGLLREIPSHQRVLNWEGVHRAAELVVVGDEDTVAAGCG